MKIAMLGVLIGAATLVAGCVTESVGVLMPEAASESEQARVNLDLGISYLQEQRPDLAIVPLVRAVQMTPRNAEAHSMLAIAYYQQGDLDQAEEHHRSATQLAPRNADVQERYAVYLCLQDRWTDAEPYFDRAVGAAGNAASIRLLVNAASCARGAGDLAAAEQSYRAALNLDQQNVDVLRGLVDVSVRTSNYLSARGFYQRLERLTQVTAQDLYACYVIESELNASEAADACRNRLQREFPGSPVLTQLRDVERDGG